jgi:hypothetical protein
MFLRAIAARRERPSRSTIFCHAFHQLVRVIPDADHCVGPRHTRCTNIVSKACLRVRSESSVKSEILPPSIVCKLAPTVPKTDRDRTTTPRTTKIVHDSEFRYVEAGRCHVGLNVCWLRMDDGRHELRFAVSGQLSCKRRECRPNAQVQLQARYDHCGEAASGKSACLLQRSLASRSTSAESASLNSAPRRRPTSRKGRSRPGGSTAKARRVKFFSSRQTAE